MARSGPVTADDFLASDIRERLAEIFNDARLSLDSFSASVKSAAQETKNSLGKTLPETEAQLRLFNATLKDTERGTRDYYAILQQKKSLMEAERDMVPVITNAYDNLNSQYVKARNNARELGVMHGVQSAQFKQASSEAQILNDRLKAIDASMGSYQRSVGNYGGAIRPVIELIRGLSYTLGVNIEGLREYAGILRGSMHLNEMFGQNVKQNTDAVKKNTDALQVNNEQLAANTLATEEAKTAIQIMQDAQLEQVVVNEAVTVSNEEVAASLVLSLPIIGWVIAGMVALAGIFYGIRKLMDDHNERINNMSKAMNGVVIVDKAQRDSFNESLIKIKELSDAYDVLTGKMNTYQAEVNKSNLNAQKNIQDLMNKRAGAVEAVSNWFERQLYGTDEIQKWKVYKTFVENVDNEITRVQTENALEVAKAHEEERQKMIQVDSDYRTSSLKDSLDIAKAQTALIRNDYDRETKQRELERANAIAVLREKQDTLTKLHSGDVDYTDKYAEISNEIGKINEVAHNEQLKADRDYAREHLKIMRDLKLESMKLSGNAVETEQTRYSNQVADIYADANSTPKEKHLQLENAERQHQEAMINIVYDYATKSANIRKNSDSLIQDGYLKEKQISQDTYDQKVREIQKEYDLSAKTALDDYNYKTSLSNAAREQTQRDFEYQLQRLKEIQALIDKNRSDTAKNQSDYDKLHHPFDYKKQASDQTADVNANAQSQTDQVQAQQDALLNGRSKNDLMLNGSNDDIKQYQALEDEKTNITRNAANQRYAIAQQLAEKEQELEAKRMTAILDATQETLNTENQLQMNNLKIQNDQLSSQAQVQATLAAEGRENSLAQVMKAQNDAAEAAKALQRKQAEEQEAMELAKLYISEKAAYVKGGDNPTQAAVKALQDVLLTKAVAAGLSQSFAEGVERVQGPGTHTSDSIPAWLSKDESIITAAATLKHPGLPTALNNGKLDEWMLSNYLPQFNAKVDMNNDEQIMKMLIDAQVQGTDKIVDAIKSKLEVIYTADGRIERENGNQTRVIVHNSNIIPTRRGFKR